MIICRLELKTIPEDALICPKHRLKFGIGWKPPSVSCHYPGHKKTKVQIFETFHQRLLVKFIAYSVVQQRMHLFQLVQNGATTAEPSEWLHLTEEICLPLSSVMLKSLSQMIILKVRTKRINRSMSSISTEWTPIKYQLRQDSLLKNPRSSWSEKAWLQ